jgi:hypothetical protein
MQVDVFNDFTFILLSEGLLEIFVLIVYMIQDFRSFTHSSNTDEHTLLTHPHHIPLFVVWHT